MTRLTELVRSAYQACADDPAWLWDRLDENAVFHVSGNHPLSGAHVGIPAIRRYLATVREVTGGRGGFSVTSAFADENGEVILVEGTAFHGDGPFVRTVVHRLRLRDGKLLEFRDHPFDQQTEDRFWSARVPAQRDGTEPAGGTDSGTGPGTGSATGGGSAAAVPSQPHLGVRPLRHDP